MGRKLDYKTSQEAEETMKYASEVAGERFGWFEEKTKFVEKTGAKPQSAMANLKRKDRDFKRN